MFEWNDDMIMLETEDVRRLQTSMRGVSHQGREFYLARRSGMAWHRKGTDRKSMGMEF